MKIQQIIVELLKIINPTFSKEFDEKHNFPVKFMFFHILERIRNNLNSLKVLIEDDTQNHYHAIGLICRNLLTDFISTGYIILDSKQENEMIGKIYSQFKSDLERIDSYLNHQLELNLISLESYKEINDRYNDSENILSEIKKNIVELNVKGFPQMMQIIKILHKSEEINAWKNFIIESYDLWIFFSKYEHFGWYSYSLTRFSENDIKNERIKKVLFYSTIMASSCFDILKLELERNSTIKLLEKIHSG